jgi:predicted nucleic acid-binding protein
MTSSVFLDTNGWLALLNASDELHARASEAWLALMEDGRPIVFTDWVIAETGNSLSRSRTRNRFVEVVGQLSESPRAELVLMDGNLLRRALDAYAQYTDKTWSLVDCASFELMRDRNVTEAFTNDRHFEQAGFRRLLSV